MPFFLRPDDPPQSNHWARVPRRRLLTGAGLVAAGAAAASMTFWRRAEVPDDHHGFFLKTPRTAEEVLTRLRAGGVYELETGRVRLLSAFTKSPGHDD